MPPATKRQHLRLLLRLVLLTSLIKACSCQASEPCARIEFPGLSPDQTFRAKEHSTITVPFRLVSNQSSCSESSVSHIHVSHLKESAAAVCIFKMVPNGNCLSVLPKKECLCNGSIGGAVFSKRINRNDSGAWFFTSTDRTAQSRRMELHVEYDIIQPTSLKMTALTSSSTTIMKPTLPADDETVTRDADINNNDKDDDDEPLGGAMMIALVVVGANVVTIVVVAAVIFLCLRRRAKKKKRGPRRCLPPVPDDAEHDVTTLRRQHRAAMLDRTSHTYEIAGPISSGGQTGTLTAAPVTAAPNYLNPVTDV